MADEAGFSSQIYNVGQRSPQLIEDSKDKNKLERYKLARAGQILAIDYDRYEFSIEWMEDGGGRSQIPISFPHMGPASVMGAMPEPGATGLFVFTNVGTGWGNPVLVACLPAGLSNALNHDMVKINPDIVPSADQNEILYSHRRMRKGEMQMTAALGAQVFLNHNLEMKNVGGDSILLRKGDHSIIHTAVNHHVFSSGATISSGPVVRNSLTTHAVDGKRISDVSAVTITTDEMKEIIYVSPDADAPAGLNTRYYAEHRIDVEDYGIGGSPLNDINGEVPTASAPTVTMVLGNFIGADKKNPNTYGKPLKPVLFSSGAIPLYALDQKGDRKGSFNLAAARSANGVNEPEVLGVAWGVHLPNAGAFQGMDKEGHWHVSLSASKVNPLGAGRSMSILAQGNLKEIWGPSMADANSWDLTAKGGIVWEVGKHGETRGGTGIEIRTQGSFTLEAGTDAYGVSKTETMGGAVVMSSGKFSHFTENHSVNIRGLKSESVTGGVSGVYQADFSMNVSGVFTETVMKEKQNKFGKRKTSITMGNDELTVLAGNIQSEITLGSNISKVTTGSITSEVLLGNHQTKVTTGNVENTILGPGGLTFKNLTAKMAMSVAGIAEVQGSLKTQVSSPIVQLGNGAPMGGAITGLPGIASHFDYTTGAPHKGSMKVGIA